MKILQVIPSFCFGGAETMCENLTYALTALGHQVCVVSLYNEHTPISQRMEKAGIRFYYLDKKLGLDISMVPKLVKIMKDEKPDVVHTHLDVIKYAVAAAKLAGIKKCVHTVHNVAHKEAEGLARIVNRIYFNCGWAIPVALSPEVRQTISEVYGLPEAKIPVAYNGIDLSKCKPKKKYQIAGEAILLHVGRFNEQKNHRGLMRAFQLVLEEVSDCRLILLGDGELKSEIEEFARELDVIERVDFLGNQADVYPFLQHADIFLLPSVYEGMPMSIIEAMGSALPIVATPVGGVPDMLTNGVSGLLTDLAPERIRDGILELLRDASLREKLGRTAREDSVRFSAEYMAKEYCNVYTW